MRSAPERSTRQAMPGNFVSEARAIASENGKSRAAYQTILHSRRAASVRAGVITIGSGAAFARGAAHNVSPSAAVPFRTRRRETASLSARRSVIAETRKYLV